MRCHPICTGIQALIRHRRRAHLVHDADILYPVGRGRPRKNPLGIVSKHEVVYDCPACMRRLHKSHPAHTRNNEPLLLCKHYNHAPENWICPACLAVKPRDDPAHTKDEGCKYGVGGQEVYRKIKKQFGVKAKAGPIRDPAIPAAGETDRRPITDDVDLEADIGAINAPGVISTPDGVIGAPGAISAPGDKRVVTEDETLGIMRGDARTVTKEERRDTHQNAENLPDLVDLTRDEAENDGSIGRLCPITIREQRIAKTRRVLGLNKEHEDRGDQADQAAAEDHRTTDVTTALQLLRSSEEATIRKALQRHHVKWYHCETERLQSLLKAAGAPSKAINLFPQIIQARQICRPWKKPSQSNQLTYSLATNFNEEVQIDLLFYQSKLEPSLGGAQRIPIIHLIDCCRRWSTCLKPQSKTTKDLLNKISLACVDVFGGMNTLTLDGETGMRGKDVDDWATYNEITLKYKAPHQKAWLVKRHNALTKATLQRAES